MKDLITKEKNIGIFTIVITFLAIAHEGSKMLYYSNFFPAFSNSLPFKILAFSFNFFELSGIWFLRIFEFNFFQSGIQINYINILFCAVMLGGCILYYASKFEAIKAIQMLFTLIFFKNLIEMVYTSISLFKLQSFEFIQIIIVLIYLGIKMVIILFTYWIIKEMLSKQELISTQEGEFYFWIPASKLTRIAHVLLDLFFCYLLFGDIARQLVQNSIIHALLRSLGNVNSSLPLYITVIIFRLIYYLIFEGIFGTTPAKIITNTLLVNNEGKKANFSSIFKRTLIRFIPLESLSFITYGWHDTWSNTNVLKLKPTKISGLNYFIVFVIIAVGLYYGLYYLENNARN